MAETLCLAECFLLPAAGRDPSRETVRFCQESSGFGRGILENDTDRRRSAGIEVGMDEERKAEKKEMLLSLVTEKRYRPMKPKELAGLLQVPRAERGELNALLDEMILEGKLMQDRTGRIQAAGADMKTGIFSGTQKGYGFVAVDGEREDIFIPLEETNGAFDQDRVQILLTGGDGGRRREGRVLKVLERGTKELVGMYEAGNGFGYVIPDQTRFAKDIYIPKGKSSGAVTGHKVQVRILDYGDDKKNPEGEVVRILGHRNDPGVDVLSVVLSHNLPEEFPQEVMEEAAGAPCGVTQTECRGRLDLREWQTVTIDGEDAKDLDDAVTLTEKDGIYTLGVHIADVTHYVWEGSALDQEAVRRGTSVYLVDRVIPMLPHRLSNGICSLNEGCDRLALSCIMEVDGKGNVISHQIEETIIRVDHRMSYTSVKKILEDGDEAESAKYEELLEMFWRMEKLGRILREKRRQRGSLDFDFPESKITLDPAGRPVDIRPYERNTATKIIEEFMLLANETVAEDYYWQEIPFLYRTHDTPDSERIRQLTVFIRNFGYSMKGAQAQIHPKEIQKLLEKIEGTPEEALISRITLRSMKRARYSAECSGHFGLSAKYYCHFTSPIRRYPDLQIHRIIKENLHGGLNEDRIRHYAKLMPEIAAWSSRMERRADEAERDVEKAKKAEYMERFIGRAFEGVISGVTAWGLYVELPNTVEGMIHISALQDDYYTYKEDEFLLAGEETGREYRLGQKIQVCAAGVDKVLHTIDFEPARLYNE